MFFEFDDYELMKAKIKVVGVGGAGGNALNRMIEDQLLGVEFVAVNTDAQDLDNNQAAVKIQIGRSVTKGLGAGADEDQGRQAVEEDHDAIQTALKGADMVFITAGMGAEGLVEVEELRAGDHVEGDPLALRRDRKRPDMLENRACGRKREDVDLSGVMTGDVKETLWPESAP